MVFTNQRGEFQTFATFLNEFEVKFKDVNLKRKSDVKDIVYRHPLPSELAADIFEPEAVNKVLEYNRTTISILSQDFINLATYNKEDSLHCVVSGLGELVTLVSPYQRFGINAGRPAKVENPETKKVEDVHISRQYSFMELDLQRIEPDHVKFLRPIKLKLSPGDCVYIPMNWWFQIRTMAVGNKRPRGQEAVSKFEADRRKLSVSVDFWYGIHSLFVRNVFDGIESGGIS